MTTVGKFFKRFGIIDPAVSVISRSAENVLLERFSKLNVDVPVQSYRRYGYSLLNYVAQRFWNDCCVYHRLNQKVFNRFRARMFNSGMSAIVAMIEALGLSPGDTVIHHRDCYFATAAYLQILRQRGIIVLAVDVRDLQSVQALCCGKAHGRTLIVTESVSNHIRMVTAPLAELATLAASASAYLLIDNTLPGACQVEPTIFCSNDDHVIYTESLTKYYHNNESGKRSVGIAIFPDVLREQVDHVTAVFGFYLQLHDVLELPHELFCVGAARIVQIANTTRLLTEYLVSQQRSQRLPFIISVPTSYEGESGVIPWSGVIFMRLEPHGQCTAAQCVARLLSETGFPERGSFGHQTTTVLPIGLRWKDIDDGIVRIAIGSGDSIDDLRRALGRFFAHY